MTFEEWWNTKDYPDCCLLRCKRAFNEGRAELEKENEQLKSVAQFQQSSNMKRHFEIQELEKKNKKLESDFRICEKNADTYYDQRTKAKEIIKEFVLWANWEGANCPNFKDIQSKAEQFLKEGE